MTVAPLMLLTSADWAASTSLRSKGAARLLIWMDFRSSSVSWSAVTSVIAPAFTVICTWTEPNRVGTTAPSYVAAAAAAAPAEPDAPVEPAAPDAPADPDADEPDWLEEPAEPEEPDAPVAPAAPVSVPADVAAAEL